MTFLQRKTTVGRTARSRGIRPAALRRFGVGLVSFLLLFSLSYVVLFPFLAKLSSALMSQSDLYDSMVALVPRHPTLDNFASFIREEDFGQALFNTALYALLTGVCTVISATMVGYGLARYQFRSVNLWFVLLVITMLIPNLTVMVPLYSTFRFFDIGNFFGLPGLFELIGGQPLRLTESVAPAVILSITCLGFRGGIHAILMRQYFKGVPMELSEAAYVDGAGHFRTFFSIILPMAKAMMVVVFVLSFAWQWTDTYYADILYSGQPLLSNKIMLLMSTSSDSSEQYLSIVRANAAALLMLAPLIVLYLVFQRKIVEGIERAGLVG